MAGARSARPRKQFPEGGIQMAASIEVVSLLLAEGFGVAALLHTQSSIEVVLVYVFGIACGALGSRLSAIMARASERTAAETCVEFRHICARCDVCSDRPAQVERNAVTSRAVLKSFRLCC